MGVTKIEAGDTGGRLIFNEKPNIDPAKLIQLIQTQPQHYRLDGGQKLQITQAMPDVSTRHTQITTLLGQLQTS